MASSECISQILEEVNRENWVYARELINQFHEVYKEIYTDLLGILEASVCMWEKDWNGAYEAVCRGLQCNGQNHELYFMQGRIKEELNDFRGAYLCYANSIYYANDEDKDFLENFLNRFKKVHTDCCERIVILIIANGELSHLENCIESICRSTSNYLYEIVCADMGTNHEISKWLEKQKNIQIINASDTHSLSEALHIGLAYALNQEKEVFLLNTASVLFVNALFNLALTISENDNVGIVASYSQEADNVEQFYERAKNNYIYISGSEEKRISLEQSNGILIRKEFLKQMEQFDNNIKSIKYSIQDLCLRSLDAGYENMVNWQSHIYPAKESREYEATNESLDVPYMQMKWKIDISYYNTARTDLIGMMNEEGIADINVLEIGCGMGATLLEIKRQFPNAKVYGVEIDKVAAHFASKMATVLCANIEDITLDFPEEFFDYIILGDVLEHLVNPEKVLFYLRKFLKKEGYLLTSIPNVQHFSVIIPLLCGEFEYQDSGILDRTHLRFFTLSSISKMFGNTFYEIVEIRPSINDAIKEPWIEEFLNKLCAINGALDRNGFEVWQYRLKVKK